MRAATASPIICPKLIGRADHLSALRLMVERTLHGQGQVALCCGEAGIGKSRLAAEVKTYARQQEFLVLQGNCFPNDRSYPYAPILDLLRSFVAADPPAPLRNALSS